MNRLEYYMHCMRRMMRSGSLKETVADTAVKAGRTKAYIYFDMLRCALLYGVGYTDYRLCEFYDMSRRQRNDCMTEEKNNRIIARYNASYKHSIFDDKGRFNRVYGEYLGRDWLDLRECGREAFEEFAQKHERFIAKPPLGIGGHGIAIIEASGDLGEVYDRLVARGQAIVEELIEQHEELAAIYPDSVNTMRMYTFYDGKQGHLLQQVIKFGNGGAKVDNFSSGGMYTFLDRNGVILYPAIDGDDRIYERHPATGVELVGRRIPFFREAEELVVKASGVTPEMGYLGWDVAVTPTGPVIVEGNDFGGIFEPKARFLNGHSGSLPEYRKYMDIKL